MASPLASVAAITWSVYNLIPGKWKKLFFEKNYGVIPIFPVLYFQLSAFNSYLVGESAESVLDRKLGKSDSSDGQLIRSPFVHYFPNFLLGCAIIFLTFVFPLFIPMGVVLVALVRILSKENYKTILRKAWGYVKHFFLKIIPILPITIIWIIWKIVTGYNFGYFKFTHLCMVTVKKRFFFDDEYKRDKAIRIDKQRQIKERRLSRLERDENGVVTLKGIFVGSRWSGVFFIVQNLSFIIFKLWMFCLFLIWVIWAILPSDESRPEWNRGRSGKSNREGENSGFPLFTFLLVLLQVGLTIWVSIIAFGIVFFMYAGLVIGIIYSGIALGAAGGLILVALVAIFLAMFIFFPLSALLGLLFVFYWFSLQLKYLSIAVILVFTFIVCLSLGIYFVRKLRQYVRNKNDSLEAPRKYDMKILNETRFAKKYLEYKNKSNLSSEEIIIDASLSMTAESVEDAEERYGYYFDEAETIAWMRRKPVGALAGFAVLCIAGVSSFFVATNSHFDEFVAPSYDQFIEFIADTRDSISDLLHRLNLLDFSSDSNRKVSNEPAPIVSPTLAVPPTTTTEPFRLVGGEGDCIQGEEFFFGGGCIPCETNPSQPACQIDASATRDLECSIAEFEFGGGCVPCSANPQACAPPGLECAADEFIFGGGCVPCAVDPDSCGDGQNGPATEGVSYTGVLRDGQTRAPPVFASGIADRAKNHLPFGSSGRSPT